MKTVLLIIAIATIAFAQVGKSTVIYSQSCLSGNPACSIYYMQLGLDKDIEKGNWVIVSTDGGLRKLISEGRTLVYAISQKDAILAQAIATGKAEIWLQGNEKPAIIGDR
jgi:hypothetical protein